MRQVPGKARGKVVANKESRSVTSKRRLHSPIHSCVIDFFVQCQPADGGDREGMWRGSGASGAAHERRRVLGA